MSIAVATAGLVALGGGGDAIWLALPGILLAAALADETGGAVLSAAVVWAAAMAPLGVWASLGPLPSPLLVGLVPTASVGVLLGLRMRLGAERDALRASALCDPLTGTANRRALRERLEYEVTRHARQRRPFAVLVLDLDGFKGLNDRFGHPAGDELLRDVADALRRAVREQDTVARTGGDEFCVLAPETDDAGAARLSDRIEASVRRVTIGLQSLSASLGRAQFPRDGADASSVLTSADESLLEAKRLLYARGERRRRAA